MLPKFACLTFHNLMGLGSRAFGGDDSITRSPLHEWDCSFYKTERSWTNGSFYHTETLQEGTSSFKGDVNR